MSSAGTSILCGREFAKRWCLPQAREKKEFFPGKGPPVAQRGSRSRAAQSAPWRFGTHHAAAGRASSQAIRATSACDACYIKELPGTKIGYLKAIMANTTALSKEERKKTKRAARKKRKLEHPLKPREYARGSQKRKVKKMVRGQAKR